MFATNFSPTDFPTRRAALFSAFAAIVCTVGTGAGVRAQTREVGTAPAGFESSGGQWRVAADATVPTGNVIEQSGAASAEAPFPIAILKAEAPKNAEIRLAIRAELSGGLALRLRTSENYYLVALDARRGQIVFSIVNGPDFVELESVDADIAQSRWYALTVRAVDDKFVVSLDNTWMFTVFDRSLTQAGRIALWTRRHHAFFDSRNKPSSVTTGAILTKEPLSPQNSVETPMITNTQR